jgi:hypothetical protein
VHVSIKTSTKGIFCAQFDIRFNWSDSCDDSLLCRANPAKVVRNRCSVLGELVGKVTFRYQFVVNCNDSDTALYRKVMAYK